MIFLEHLDTNVIRFPVELRRPSLDTLIAIEPDVLLADQLAAQHDIEALPFDSIECGEHEARDMIAEFGTGRGTGFRAGLQQMSDAAIALAITRCRQARHADALAAKLRHRANEITAGKPAPQFFHTFAANAEREAAIKTIAAIAAAHRARGIDAVVRCALSETPYFMCCGIIDRD